MEYKYYLAQLNDSEATLYSFIYNELLNRANSFDINAPTDIIDQIMKYIMLDNPELFWFEGKWKATYEGNIIRVIPHYKMRLNYNRLFDGIERTISAVLKSCIGSDIDNIKAVYDWLQSNVQYCYTDNDQTIEGVFIEHRAVCKGISKAFQLLMNKLNIPSFLIEGTLDGKSSHVWNVVFVNNKFYHVDVAIGYQRFSSLFSGMDRNRHYPCFMVSDKTINATHMIYRNYFPACSEDFDLNQYFVESLKIPKNFKKYGMLAYLDKGSTCTVLKVTNNKSEYALKVIEARDDGSKYQYAYAELEKMKLLANCNIVNLVDSFVSLENKTVYILTDYYKPLTIRRKEENFETIKGTLNLGIDILTSLMNCRNKGIYHLDIQPKNIYFDRFGKAVLGDFGNAVFESELSTLNPKRGTIAFMAPEVYHRGIYGQVSEIYSLGIVLYSLLNESLLPFTNENTPDVSIKMRLSGEKLPPPHNCYGELWNCINKMCAYNIDERFVTYEDALLGIKKILEN